MNAAEVRRRLGVKFGSTSQAVRMPEHLILTEVPVPGLDGYGYTDRHGTDRTLGSRRIDVMAVGMWSRTRYLVHGFEIKCSRADLVGELRNPSKAAAGMAVCNRWWLVISDPKLLRDSDELPAPWGVIAPRGRGLTIIREPEPLPAPARSPLVLAQIVGAAMRTHGACRGMAVVDGYLRGYKHGTRAGAA